MPTNKRKAVARELRRNATDAERHLWYWLRGRRLGNVKFRRQFPVGRYVVDFVSLERKVVVELDGGQHADQVHYDETRTRHLQEEGFRVLRFWNDQVLKETEAVLLLIRDALGPAASTAPATPMKTPLTRPLRGRPLPEGEAKRP